MLLVGVPAATALVDMLPPVPKGTAPRIFDDHMVLQRDTIVPVFGRAAPGEMVTVEFNGQTKSTLAEVDGSWTVSLDPMAAGGPFDMTISGENVIQLTDIMVGDVWVFTGQSNMLIRRPSPSVVLEHPQVRSISRRNWSDRPGGTPFWLGVQLSQWLGIPVGVINRAERGAGSGIQGWLSPAAASDPDPQVQSLLPSYGDGIYNQFDSLFAPIVPYAIRGVVWWQGEGDLRKTSELPADGILDYRILLPAVIRSWRYEWGQGDFPFLFVQLPVGGGLPAGVPVSALPAAPPASDRASLMRQAFLGALEAPNSWMVVSVDLEGGVHPKDRDAYHDRISRVIRTASYADPSVYSGPVFESATLEGNRVRIRFRVQTATGLHTDGGPLQGFSISADGEAFLWAEGQIEGEEVVVWNDAIVTPVEVRYAWNKSPVWANLFNSENLGASPFAAEIVSP